MSGMAVYALDHDKLDSQQCVNMPLFAIGIRFLSLSICCANVNKNELTNSDTFSTENEKKICQKKCLKCICVIG